MESMRQRIATWVAMQKTAFCNAKSISLSRFLELDDQYKLINHLYQNYELLHYYSDDDIVEDIDRYITEQGDSINELS